MEIKIGSFKIHFGRTYDLHQYKPSGFSAPSDASQPEVGRKAGFMPQSETIIGVRKVDGAPTTES